MLLHVSAQTQEMSGHEDAGTSASLGSATHTLCISSLLQIDSFPSGQLFVSFDSHQASGSWLVSGGAFGAGNAELQKILLHTLQSMLLRTPHRQMALPAGSNTTCFPPMIVRGAMRARLEMLQAH